LKLPPGVFSFDGERFGFPALILVNLKLEYAAQQLRDSNAWKRFMCNRGISSYIEADAIDSVICFSHSIFANESWLGIALRKSGASDYGEFCRQARKLAADTDIAALINNSSTEARGVYIMLPPRCAT
jgi:hypothetical protein